MLKQLRHDVQKLIFQKRYLMILLGILLFSAMYAIYLAQKGLSSTEMVYSGLSQLRPIYWLICCYMICDVISSDYHNKTLKTTILYSKSRTAYIASKSILSASICFLALLVHMISSLIATVLFSPHMEWVVIAEFFALASTGALSTIFLFVGLFILCMIVSENEAVTIGFSMGTVIIMLIMESIEQLSKYVPTIQMITLKATIHENLSIGMIIISTLVLLAILFTLLTTSIFRRKDLFV